MHMKFPDHLLVTDQHIDLSQMTEVQQEFFINLKTQLEEHYRAQGEGRQVFFLAGPGGTGKSVTAAILNVLFSDVSDFEFVSCGIDAFHYSNEYLSTHKLTEHKGRFDTYDTNGIYSTLSKFKQGKSLSLPKYSRETHDPVPNVTQVTDAHTLWLFEGGWLLYQEEPWKSIQSFADYKLSIEARRVILKQNVINRHAKGGKSHENATSFYEQSDIKNTELILKNSNVPDRILKYYDDI